MNPVNMQEESFKNCLVRKQIKGFLTVQTKSDRDSATTELCSDVNLKRTLFETKRNPKKDSLTPKGKCFQLYLTKHPNIFQLRQISAQR